MRTAPRFWTRQRTGKASGAEVREWSRARLLSTLWAAAMAAAALLVGLVYALYLMLAGAGEDPAADQDVATGEDDRAGRAQGTAHRDAIAAAPMLEVPADAMFPAKPADPPERAASRIEIPPATVPGPGLVMTGFPHTPEGAIGQLAQIDLTVLGAMSVPSAREVYRTWALPGGTGPEQWWITTSVESFLTATGTGEGPDPGIQVTVDPAAALVKGTDGPDWVTGCALLTVTASYRQDGQVAFGHCERLQWVGGRWMIAPGRPPAPAPSTWPGTDLAAQAGWRTWTTGEHTPEPTGGGGSQ